MSGAGSFIPEVPAAVQASRRSSASVTAAPGHSQQYLSDLERGRRNPTVVTLAGKAARYVLANE